MTPQLTEYEEHTVSRIERTYTKERDNSTGADDLRSLVAIIRRLYEPGPKHHNFQTELQHLLNRFSMENGSNTPDYLLAEFLTNSLNAFNLAVTMRETWYGVKHQPGGGCTVVSKGPEPI